MKEITSRNNEYILKLSKLNNKKDIEKEKLFLVEGKNLIKEAIDLNIVKEILFVDEKLVKEFSVPKIKVTNEIISKLSSNKTNNGIIAICNYNEKKVDLKDLSKIIVLEEVNNPSNLGAIARSALAFGFDAIITLDNSVFHLNEKCIRASQGSIFKLPIINLKSFKDLKDFYPYKFILSSNSKSMEDIDFKKLNKKIALVFGNEANGLSKDIIDNWKGENIIIDIKNIDSLNLSIAASIAMYKFK